MEDRMANIISNINILDVVIITVPILLLLFGIWRGMYKLVYGLISSIVALVLAIMLTSNVVTFTIDNTQLDEKLNEVISKPLDSYVPNAKKTVAFYDLDNNPDTPDELGFDSGSGIEPFENILKDSKIRFLSAPIKTIVTRQVEKEGESTFLNAMVAYIMAYVFSAVAFIILWILFFILMKVLFAALKKVVSSTYLGYYLDKIVGGLLGLVISGVLIFGFLTIVKLMGNYPVIISVNNMIDDSTVTKILAENNFVYGFIEDKIDMQSLIDKLMEMISKAGL